MNAERYRRLREVFVTACDLADEARREYLDSACAGDNDLRAQVDALLQHDRDEVDMLHPAAGDDASAHRRAVERLADVLKQRDRTPRRVGRYRIVRTVAEGGMGTVYEAEQDAPKRTVALKVVRPGIATEHSLRRFEYEAQVLALLHHPGIAQIHEAGTARTSAGTQPFFAMELVDGVPITEYVRDRALATRDRLHLLAFVCDAVHHAHQKGVIHRDLKPGNILVAEPERSSSASPRTPDPPLGRPKILDFGVAKATDLDVRSTTLRTNQGQLIGTVPYMSPEQATGRSDDIDTRSDVYALGVIACEMLTGRLPYDLDDKSLPEAVRIIREQSPIRIGSLNRTLRGDAETIVSKALEKDKDRRYESAAALAADIRRYLKDEPIVARPPSALYQLRKFARRNRALVGVATAALLILVVAVVGTSYGLAKARHHERQAQMRATEATAAEQAADDARSLAESRLATATSAQQEADLIHSFLSSMLTSARPSEHGHDVLVVDVLEDAMRSIESIQDTNPCATATVLKTLGSTFAQLGNYASSLECFDRAVTLIDSAQGCDDGLRLQIDRRIGSTHLAMGNYVLAREMLTDLVEPVDAFFGQLNPESVLLRLDLARLRSTHDDYLRAIPMLLDTLKEESLTPVQWNETTPWIAESLGILEMDRSQLAAAYGHFLMCLDLATTSLKTGAAHCLPLASPHTDIQPSHIQTVLSLLVRLYESHYGPQDPATLRLKFYLADSLIQTGEYAKAETLIIDVHNGYAARSGHDHPWTLHSRVVLADAYQRQGRLNEARCIVEEVLPHLDDTLGRHHRGSIRAAQVLASVHARSGARLEAERTLRQTIAVVELHHGTDHLTLLNLNVELALITLFSEQHSEAIEHLERLYERYSVEFGSAGPPTLRAMSLVGTAKGLRGDIDTAFSMLTRAYREQCKALGELHPDALQTQASLAALFDDMDVAGAAEVRLREYLAKTIEQLGLEHQHAFRAIVLLTQYLAGVGRVSDAIGTLSSYEDRYGRLLGRNHIYVLELQRHQIALHLEAGHFALASDLIAALDRKCPDTSEYRADILDSRGVILRYHGHYADALPLFEQSLALRRARYGDYHKSTLTTLQNVATTLYDLGRFAEARAVGTEVVHRREQVSNDTDEQLIVARAELAYLHHLLGDDEEAYALLTNSLVQVQQNLPVDNMNTVAVTRLFAAMLAGQGRYDEALPVMLGLVDSDQQTYGESHGITLASMQNLGHVYIGLGRHSDAESILQAALQRASSSLPSGHPTIGTMMMNLGQCLARQGRLDEAVRALNEAQAVLSAALGPDHPASIRASSLVAETLRPQQDGGPDRHPAH